MYNVELRGGGGEFNFKKVFHLKLKKKKKKKPTAPREGKFYKGKFPAFVF